MLKPKAWWLLMLHSSSLNASPMAFEAKRTALPSGGLCTSFRFRFVPVGKNLKPVKPFVVTTRRFELAKEKPELVSP